MGIDCQLRAETGVVVQTKPGARWQNAVMLRMKSRLGAWQESAGLGPWDWMDVMNQCRPAHRRRMQLTANQKDLVEWSLVTTVVGPLRHRRPLDEKSTFPGGPSHHTPKHAAQHHVRDMDNHILAQRSVLWTRCTSGCRDVKLPIDRERLRCKALRFAEDATSCNLQLNLSSCVWLLSKRTAATSMDLDAAG
jgi:hypothetical protein